VQRFKKERARYLNAYNTKGLQFFEQYVSMKSSKKHYSHYCPCYILCGTILLKLVIVKVEAGHDKVSEAVHLEKRE
jgi:hypothetical protein